MLLGKVSVKNCGVPNCDCGTNIKLSAEVRALIDANPDTRFEGEVYYFELRPVSPVAEEE